MKSTKWVIIICIIIVVGILNSCYTMPKMEEPMNNKASLVFGYMDMKEAPSCVRWVDMRQLRPKTDKPIIRFRVLDGIFFKDNIQPGIYQFIQFGNVTSGFVWGGNNYI